MKERRMYMDKGLKIAKIVVTVAAILSLGLAAFFLGAYYVGGLSYLYHSEAALKVALTFVGIMALALAVTVALAVLMFKSRKVIGIICSVLLILLIPVAHIASLCGIFISIANGAYGCSYTEDVQDYGILDGDVKLPSYFPESLTNDMTVAKYTYFYKEVDRSQVDLYLEVSFENRETMERYLTEAKQSLSAKGVEEYQNPYNGKYTDVIGWQEYIASKDEWYLDHSLTDFQGREDYQYVWTAYRAVVYSYEDLTVIYNYTSLGEEICVGSDPDNNEYYPEILERFNVEWSKKNSFNSRDFLGEI